MRKITFFLIAFCVINAINQMQGQNPELAFPPDYYDSGTNTSHGLPTNTVSTSYGTTILRDQYLLDAYGPANMVADASGNTVFFIVGGFVFNPYGYIIDTLLDSIPSYYTALNPPSSPAYHRPIATGWADVCIVPDPGNCSRYYIFTAVDYGSSANSTFDSHYQVSNANHMGVCFMPKYTVIDVSLPTPGAPQGYGKNIIVPATGHGPKIWDLYSKTSTQPAIGGGGTDPASPYPGNVHYACSRLQTVNGAKYRYLYMFCYDEVKVYQITTSSVVFVKNYDLSKFAGDESLDDLNDQYWPDQLAELEISEDSANNKIHMAGVCSYLNRGSRLFFADFTRSTGLMDTTTVKEICFTSPCVNDTELITGVEFSPNGSYVFITRKPNSASSASIMQINYSTPTTRYTLSTAATYSNCMIEAGTDGNLYLANPSGSNQITSPNTTSAALSGTSYGYGYFNYVPNYTNWSGPYGGYGWRQIGYMPDQIDGETYGAQFNASTACCLRYSSYDKYQYNTKYPQSGYSAGTHTVQVWKPNTTSGSYQNNPLTTTTSSTVNIGEELRIAAGYTVTIQNMTLKFSPAASLIIEGANGSINAGVLYLKKCTLDVDTRCETKMWPGVRIWGDNTITRSTGNQGYINIDSMSVIQNAWIGVETGYNTADHQYVDGVCPLPSDTTKCGGGNVYCNNSSFINNQRDIFFTKYTAATGGVSNIFNSTFTTNAYLVGGSSIKPLYHIQFDNFKPSASIKGNVFSCSTSLTATGYVYAAYGIYSLNSYFVADQNTGNIRNKFSNFAYGVYAYNTSGNAANVAIKNSSFYDNKVGTYFGLMANGDFESDTVKIWCNSSGNASGLYLDNCNGYKVQFNYFTKGSGSVSNTRFGTVAYNSGSYVNCIFNNTYNNLYKGIQPQYRNYISNWTGGNNPNSGGGLVILCNTFTVITNGDIYIPQTGSAQNVGGVYSGTDSAGINYEQGTGGVYPITGGNHFSHTSGSSAWDFYIDTAGKAFNSNYISYCASGCPNTSSLEFPAKRKNVTAPTVGTDVLCTTDPYSHGLRTENPVPGMLAMASAYKQTFDSLKAAIAASSDQQAKREMGMQMGRVLTARHALLSEVIHILQDNWNDTTEATVNSLMKEKAIDLPARSRLETGLAIHDSAFAAQALSEVAAKEGQNNYVKLYTIMLNNIGKTPEQIMADPNILSQVQAMDADSSDKHAYLAANALLRSVGLSDYQPLYQEETAVDSTQERFLNAVASSLQNNLYSQPNPFKDNTTIKATISQKTDNAYVLVTDMLGKEVGRYKVVQGDNEINFNGSETDQQIFFCTLVIDGVKIKTNKLVMIK
jgi:hypothetical protein